MEYFLRTKWRAINHHVTWSLSQRLPNIFPHYHVVGVPKSGTTWVTQLLSDVTELPFYREALYPVLVPSVLHGHNVPNDNLYNTVFVNRDGRDVMISLYFHIVRYEKNNRSDLLDPKYIKMIFPEFIKSQAERPYSCRLNWSEFYRCYKRISNNQIIYVKYEDLKKDCVNELKVISSRLGLEKSEDDLENISNRWGFDQQRAKDKTQGRNESFLRKGESGDWKNYFTVEAKNIFEKYHGDVLYECGFEHDSSWLTDD